MTSIIDAVKATLKDHGYVVRGVSYSFDHTDIGDLHERQESRISIVATGGKLAPLDMSAEGVDPVTGGQVTASLAHASCGMAGVVGVEYNLDFGVICHG